MKHFLLSSSNAVLKKPNHILNTFSTGSETSFNIRICNTVESAASSQSNNETSAVQYNSSHGSSAIASPVTKSAVKRKLDPQPEDSLRNIKIRKPGSPTKHRTPPRTSKRTALQDQQLQSSKTTENKISSYLVRTRIKTGAEPCHKQPVKKGEDTSLVGKEAVDPNTSPIPSLEKGVNK